jgi:hypothetical protein
LPARKSAMSNKLYKTFSCECGVRHSYTAYVFSYWVNEVEKVCACGRVHRISTECEQYIASTKQ